MGVEHFGVGETARIDGVGVRILSAGWGAYFRRLSVIFNLKSIMI